MSAKRGFRLAAWAMAAVALGGCQVESVFETPLTTADIRVRDPFVYPHKTGKTYLLYAQSANREGSGFKGVEVYASKDLVHWTTPRPVLMLPGEMDIRAVWAPEVHRYRGKYYLLVTLTMNEVLPLRKPAGTGDWPPMFKRGTHVYQADSPYGPFEPLRDSSLTPPAAMALDGTLYVEDGTPFMVYCHEWVEMVDGTMECVELTRDLAGIVGEPERLFKASSAPGSVRDPKRGNVTDGCFLHNRVNGALVMIWSTFLPGKGYCVMLARSESGRVRGPWRQQEPIYTRDGGHGMLFRAFDGRLMLALHQPNGGQNERLRLYEAVETEEGLTVLQKAGE